MSTSPTDSSAFVAPSPQAPAPRVWSGGRVADVVVSVILMITGVLGFAVLAFMSLFLIMMSDACFVECNTSLLSTGWLITVGVPPIVFIAAVVWTIIRLVRRKIAWWVPLAGAALSGAIWFVGVGMMNASLGR